MDLKNICVIIPSLNPDEKLEKTVDDLQKVGFDNILIVNDGSDQNHLEPFRYAVNKGCHVIVHEQNYGKGHAMKTAFKECLIKKNILGVITVDGDGQHKAEDVLGCCITMAETNYDEVVLGCRDFSQDDVPFKSRYGNLITRFVFRAFHGIKISDTQTGLRAIPTKYLPDMIECEGDRYEYESNMFLMMKDRNISIAERKIETVYIDDNESSHFNPIKDSIKIYKVLLKYSFASLICCLLDILMFYCFLWVTELAGYDEASTITIATVFARVISSIMNYNANKGLVFKSASKNSFIRYYILCVLQMLTSAGLVSLISLPLGVQRGTKTFVKVIVDCILFFISFRIQKAWVFKEDGKEEQLPETTDKDYDELVGKFAEMVDNLDPEEDD